MTDVDVAYSGSGRGGGIVIDWSEPVDMTVDHAQVICCALVED